MGQEQSVAEEQGKSETMDNKGMFMLSDDNNQEWKEDMKSKSINLGSDVWNLGCNGCTKTPPSSEELQKNNVTLNEIISDILDSTLGAVMHYETAKQVSDNLQVIHEGKLKEDCLSGEPLGNLISKDVSKDEYDDKTTFVMSNGITDSEEDRLEEVLNLRRKLDFSLKRIINLKYKLQEYDNRDHVAVESKKCCEGLDAEIISLRADLKN